MTSEQYVQQFFNLLDYVRDSLLRPIDPNSNIKTRYITSQGIDDEQWIGFLRDEARNNIVDIWLVTLADLNGLPQGQKGMMGGFDKPVSLYLEYQSDYLQGYDYDDSNPSNIKTNSEREFLKKVLALDFTLEQKTGCFPNGIELESYSARMDIKQYNTASCHRAQFVLNLKVTGNIL